MIKHLITGGCSFSSGHDTYGWTGYTTKYLRHLNPNLTTVHTGEISQGQELIQKKLVLAITKALENNIDPDSILVAVMWSGTARKAWYIDNPNVIENLVRGWVSFKGGMASQFLSLTNYANTQTDFSDLITMASKAKYDNNGGWYYTVDGSDSAVYGLREHYLLDHSISGPGKVHTSLENIIFLQNFCKLHGIKLIQQIYMDSVYQDILKNSEHQIIKYLFNQLNHKNFITRGALDFVLNTYDINYEAWNKLSLSEKNYSNEKHGFLLANDLFHLSEEGMQLYSKRMLQPYLNRITHD